MKNFTKVDLFTIGDVFRRLGESVSRALRQRRPIRKNVKDEKLIGFQTTQRFARIRLDDGLHGQLFELVGADSIGGAFRQVVHGRWSDFWTTVTDSETIDAYKCRSSAR